MNIRTSYPIQSAQMYAHKNIVSNNATPVREYQQNELASSAVCFTGWGDFLRKGRQFGGKMMHYAEWGNVFGKSKKINKDTKYFVEEAAKMLAKDNYEEKTAEMMKLVEGKSEDRLAFLNAMVDHFNGQNFEAMVRNQETENGDVVLDLFTRIAEPKGPHFGFVENTQATGLTMTDIKKCFDICDDDPEKIARIHATYNRLQPTGNQNGLIMQIVESPNAGEYIDHLEKYLPHLTAEAKTKGVIAALDEQIAKKTVDIKSSSQKHIAGEVISLFPKNDILKAEDLVSESGKDGLTVVTMLQSKFNPTEETLNAGDARGIIRIFNTTTKENAQFRKDFLDANYYNYGKRDKVGKNEINELAGLFEIADKDPDAMKFLSSLASDYIGMGRAGAYLDLIDKIGSEQLSKDVKPISKIISDAHDSHLEKVLTYYEGRSQNIYGRVLGSFKGIFGKGTQPKEKVPVKDMVTIDQMESAAKPSVVKEAAQRDAYLSRFQPGNSERVTVKPKRVRSVFKPYVPKEPSAKKLAIIKGVDSIIEKQLGAKTLSEQQRIYADKATKMRLNMLPEIFASIKEARAAERANNTFNKSKSVKNEDAVDLYTRINGKNKKLVNYMLKKRNADGTRMFSVKDIIETLSDGQRKIIQKQNEYAESKIRYNSKEDQIIYNSIFDQKVAQFGKLQRQKSAKK